MIYILSKNELAEDASGQRERARTRANGRAHLAASNEPRSPPGARRGASNEPTSPQGARSGVRTSFSNAPRTILARFWSILARFWTLRGSILEVFRRFFDAFALELANSLEEEATSGKPVKTIGKP